MGPSTLPARNVQRLQARVAALETDLAAIAASLGKVQATSGLDAESIRRMLADQVAGVEKNLDAILNSKFMRFADNVDEALESFGESIAEQLGGSSHAERDSAPSQRKCTESPTGVSSFVPSATVSPSGDGTR